ncbi:DUF5908 family protein [Erwinia persicina]|uniref:Uncharacterized protein n=1 Tax=Erwinia persicina TaxID=55211 RepID=A0ABR8ZZF9_9GAMM|nr:DUF5908 family protein [Erwinia persicina]MBD8109114.1 hypothetical protein [Erwinia persicina]MBD8170108.1 hypothetical protein [Erwinia persicina]MBD8212238.1 hypothetical protein [Erwinia persicina]
MTIEIRELVVQVRVTEPEPPAATSALTVWDEQRLLEKLKREILEYLLERGQL